MLDDLILEKKRKERQDRLFIMMRKGQKEDLQEIINVLEINKYTRFFYNSMFFYLKEIRDNLIFKVRNVEKLNNEEIKKIQNNINLINIFLKKYYNDYLD